MTKDSLEHINLRLSNNEVAIAAMWERLEYLECKTKLNQVVTFGNKFKPNDIVWHRKGGRYRIVEAPTPKKRIEQTGKTYYTYENMNTGEMWVRDKEEMEDGRFVYSGYMKK